MNNLFLECCPNCQETDVQWIEERDLYRRKCRYCGISTPWCKSDEEAIEKWNRRELIWQK